MGQNQENLNLFSKISCMESVEIIAVIAVLFISCILIALTIRFMRTMSRTELEEPFRIL